MAEQTQKKGNVNPTITTMFEDGRWGENSEGEANYVSRQIDAKDFDAISKLGIGDRILLKRVDKTTSRGNKMAFLEIVKDRTPKDTKPTAPPRKATAAPATADDEP